MLARDPNAADYFRMFLMPGVLHCGGGAGPDTADWTEAIVNWVEKGRHPIASSRPRCVNGGHAQPSAVPVSAEGRLHRIGQHRRREEFFVPEVGRPVQGRRRRWLREPQTLLLRRALFQIHLWIGIATGLYIALIALTGSILVYRNELYSAFSPQPRLVENAGTPLSREDLEAAVRRTFPDDRVVVVEPGPTPDHAADVTLERDGERTRRLVHPATGADLGPTLPLGYRVSAWMLDLHDNLLGGETGRRVNGIGAFALLVLCATGLIVWWPGVSRWRHSVFVDVRANWKRLNWSVHSVLGLWFFVFILMWSLTGVYLSLPEQVSAVLDYVEPLNEANPVERVVESDAILARVPALRAPRRPGYSGLRTRPLRFDHEGHLGRCGCGARPDGGHGRGDVVESRRRARRPSPAYDSLSPPSSFGDAGRLDCHNHPLNASAARPTAPRCAQRVAGDFCGAGRTRRRTRRSSTGIHRAR